MKKHLKTVVLGVILALNLLASIGAVAVVNMVSENQRFIMENQGVIVDNQAKLGQHIEVLQEYIGYVGGELLETDATEFDFDIHAEVIVRGPDGEIKSYSHHAGALTTLGKDWIKTMLGNNDTSASAQWIALTNTSTGFSVGWTSLPGEIDGEDNMSRRQGAYSSLGTGNWRIEAIFEPNGSGMFNRTGLYHGAGGNYLVASDTTTETNYENGDTVTLRWDVTVS